MKKSLCFVSCLALSACSLFGNGEIDLSAPAKLLDYEATHNLDRNWSQNVGAGSGEILPISIPVVLSDTIYIGDRKGTVRALEKETGRERWKTDTNQVITGAVGVGGDLVLVGTEQGVVHALNRETGELLWNVGLSSQILAAPVSNGEVVVAVTQDGKIFGLDGEKGDQIWLVDINLPILTVHGSAKPKVVDDIVYVGLDSGKVAAYRMEDGVNLWEVRVGIPEGQNDLERMVDIDGELLFHSGNIYAAAYQSGLMAINPEAGRGLWFQEGSSKNSLGAWGGTLVATFEDGVVKAFNSSEGTLLWETDEFKNREPNSPALTSDYIAFADYDGYLHLLARRTGEVIGREKVSGAGVRSPTIIDGDDVFILSNSGTLTSYKILER